MSKTGTIFDIKQLAVFDGPGIRTTVFMKGCPLRCKWCHNPEGLSFSPQLMVSTQGCTGCGRCKEAVPALSAVLPAEGVSLPVRCVCARFAGRSIRQRLWRESSGGMSESFG